MLRQNETDTARMHRYHHHPFKEFRLNQLQKEKADLTVDIKRYEVLLLLTPRE